MLIEKIIGKFQEKEGTGATIDPVLLSHYDLKRPHQKVKTAGGRELKISLDRGENLFCGAILYQDDALVIVVDMPKERVFEIKPQNDFEWAKAAYNIGNMHQNIYLYPDSIKVPYDPVLDNTIKALEISYRVTEAKLDGVQPGVSLDHGVRHG